MGDGLVLILAGLAAALVLWLAFAKGGHRDKRHRKKHRHRSSPHKSHKQRKHKKHHRHPRPATTVTLTVSPNPAAQGQTVTLTARVRFASCCPGFKVVFYDGTTILGQQVHAATADFVLQVNNLSVGTHNLKACVVCTCGPQVCSSIVALVVQSGGGSTPTSLSAPTTSDTTDYQNMGFFFRTILTPSTTSASTPTGTVSFFAGTNLVGTSNTFTPQGSGFVVQLNNNAIDWSFLLPGAAYSITASYSGDTNFAASASAPSSVFINKVATFLTSVLSNEPSGVFFLDDTFVLSTALTAPGTTTTATPTGNIFFRSDSSALATAAAALATVQVDGTAMNWNFLGVGTHTIVASYVGDAIFAGSTSATPDWQQQVLADPTSTTVNVSNGVINVGGSLMATAIVDNTETSGPPSGSVVFTYNVVSVSDPTQLVPFSTAPVLLSPSAPGESSASLSIALPVTGAITAQYTPDTANYTGSSGFSFTVTVRQPTATTVAVPAIVGAGSPMTVTVTVTADATVPPAAYPPGSNGSPDGSVDLFIQPSGPSFGAVSLVPGPIGSHSSTATFGPFNAPTLSGTYFGVSNYTDGQTLWIDSSGQSGNFLVT